MELYYQVMGGRAFNWENFRPPGPGPSTWCTLSLQMHVNIFVSCLLLGNNFSVVSAACVPKCVCISCFRFEQKMASCLLRFSRDEQNQSKGKICDFRFWAKSRWAASLSIATITVFQFVSPSIRNIYCAKTVQVRHIVCIVSRTGKWG